MQADVKLGRILGVPVGLHASWFLIFALVTWSLALGYFPSEYPGLPRTTYWLLGALTSVLFFGSVLLHELGHSLVALRNGIPVRSITLFVFGGVAQIDREPDNPGTEFRVAVAGPLTSTALAAVFGGLWLIDRRIPHLAAVTLWLARINLMLAVFNLIPGFPLDGGRVLRSLIWQATNSFQRATQVATFSGQIVAAGFIGLGLFILLAGNVFNGLWLVFIGWFLQNAAAATYAQASLREQLRGVAVSQVMARDHPVVSTAMSLQAVIDHHILADGHRCFLVVEDGRLVGVLGLRDVAAVPKAERSATTVAQVMVPWEQMSRVEPDTELMDALQLMDDRRVAQLPVVVGNSLVGMVSREHVLHYIRLRSELKI